MSPRPKQIRKISNIPEIVEFIPVNSKAKHCKKLCLNFEEYETIRLCDYEMRTQQEACCLMNISRPTLSRIYTKAKHKIAEAMVNGYGLVIDGGHAYTDSRWYLCMDCGLTFNNINPALTDRDMKCPLCHSDKIQKNENKNTDKKMKKIAIPTANNIVDNHFGHCEFYTILTIDDENKIISSESIPSPQGCGCKSNIASQLEDMGVDVMLAGNMGQGALNVLTSHNIKVLRGCSGNIMDVATDYLNGKITDSGKICSLHGEEHECGSKKQFTLKLTT